ncbi:hypothetical protein GQ54DRAFT_81091 [Martensiomyces pterosporus]|nr:hypothetical protein GQ54DRAFT_81091 [Martensiomyces pterosporus]
MVDRLNVLPKRLGRLTHTGALPRFTNTLHISVLSTMMPVFRAITPKSDPVWIRVPDTFDGATRHTQARQPCSSPVLTLWVCHPPAATCQAMTERALQQRVVCRREPEKRAAPNHVVQNSELELEPRFLQTRVLAYPSQLGHHHCCCCCCQCFETARSVLLCGACSDPSLVLPGACVCEC